MIPVIGGVFNGAINSFFTNRCFRRARKEFFYANEFIPPAILNNQSTLSKFNSVKRYVWEIQVRFWCDGRIWHSYLKRVEPKDQRKVIKLHAAYNFYRFSPNGEDPFRSILNVSNSLEHEGTMAIFPFVDGVEIYPIAEPLKMLEKTTIGGRYGTSFLDCNKQSFGINCCYKLRFHGDFSLDKRVMDKLKQCKKVSY